MTDQNTPGPEKPEQHGAGKPDQQPNSFPFKPKAFPFQPKPPPKHDEPEQQQPPPPQQSHQPNEFGDLYGHLGSSYGGGYSEMPPPPPPATAGGPQVPEEQQQPAQDPGWQAASSIYGGDRFAGTYHSISDVEIPDEPPPPPNETPPQAIFASIGAGILGCIGWALLSNTCCGLYFWTWIFGLAAIGTGVGSAAARFGGNGRRMGVICVIVAFLAMLFGGFLSFIITALIQFAQQEAAPDTKFEQRVAAQKEDEEFATTTVNETFDMLESQQQSTYDEYSYDEYEDEMYYDYSDENAEYASDVELYETEAIATEDSYDEEYASAEPGGPSGIGSLFWGIFFIFNVWGVFGIIVGLLSAYKIGSGFNQPGYSR